MPVTVNFIHIIHYTYMYNVVGVFGRNPSNICCYLYKVVVFFLKCNICYLLCLAERSLPTLWVGTSGGLVCVYEFTLGSTTDVEQSPPLKCVLGKPFTPLTLCL